MQKKNFPHGLIPIVNWYNPINAKSAAKWHFLLLSIFLFAMHKGIFLIIPFSITGSKNIKGLSKTNSFKKFPYGFAISLKRNCVKGSSPNSLTGMIILPFHSSHIYPIPASPKATLRFLSLFTASLSARFLSILAVSALK